MELSPSFARVGFVFFLLTMQGRYSRGGNQTALLSFLFSKYESSTRPVCNDSDQVVSVSIDFAVRQIIDLDEPKQILVLNAWIHLTWNDCQIFWDPANYGNISSLVLPYDKLWSPDITLYDKMVSSTDGELSGLKDYRIRAKSDGSMTYNFPTVISVMCKIDVTYFPFDTQRCPLQFGSWAHSGLEVDITNGSETGDLTSLIKNSEFDITSMPVVRHVTYYPDPYPDVTFYITMKRKPLFYILNLLFPCILITTVSLLGFLLPPDAGEKISLEITVLLSLAVFLLVVSEMLPPTSETFPYIGIYFACTMLLVSLSTLLTVVVLNVHHNEYKPVPQWLRVIVLRYLARVVCFSEVSGVVPRKDTNNRDVALHNGHANGHDISRQSTLSNKWADPCGNGPVHSEASSRENPSAQSIAPSQFAPLIKLLSEQLELMQKAEARKLLKQRYDHENNEWKRVGIVLDRVFLMAFTIVSVVITLALLLPLSQQ